MGDPREEALGDHDPNDPSSSYSVDHHHLLHEFHNPPNPTLNDIYDALAAEISQSGQASGSGFQDPNAWNTGQASGAGPSHGYNYAQAGPSACGMDTGMEDAENLTFDFARPLSVWPPPPAPYNCSCCHVLREIIHVRGNHLTKLELHGRLGLVSHAILENRHVGNSNFQMLDFCKRSMEDVKKFLRDYCEERVGAGYHLIPDSLSTYYETVCIGLAWDDNILDDTDDFLGPSPPGPGGPLGADETQDGPPENPPDGPPENPPDQPPENPPPPPPTGQQPEPPQNNQAALTNNLAAARNNQAEPMNNLAVPTNNLAVPTNDLAVPANDLAVPANDLAVPMNDQGKKKKPRTFLALQRERTGKLTVRDLAGYFHLTIKAASRRIKLCPTVLKKICRRDGVLRWPQRNITGKKKKIEKLQEKLGSRIGQKYKHAIQAEIELLRHQIVAICFGVPQVS